MDEIYTIYHNEYGMAFQWKRGAAKNLKKIQLVFRDTGLFLTTKELTQFAKMISNSIKKPLRCDDCKTNRDCKSLLLETPAFQVSLAMSYNELLKVNDLVKGTLFELQIKAICKNLSIETGL